MSSALPIDVRGLSRYVCFLIRSVRGKNTGSGGHYYSMLALCKSLSVPYRIVVIGDFFPVALAHEQNVVIYEPGLRGRLKFIRDNWFAMREIIAFHAMDRPSGLWIQPVADIFRKRLVVTKAGGAPEKVWRPRFTNMIYFQRSEYEVELKRRCLRYWPRYIPNRIKIESLSPIGAENPFQNASAIKILRICRIGRAYAGSLYQTAALARELTAGGFSCEAVVIGVVEHAEVFREASRRLNGQVKMLTDDKWTTGASKHLSYADLVVGTGRGAMEAMCLGKICFVPAAGAALPLILTPDNFESAFRHNFSPRLKVEELGDPEKSIDITLHLLSSPADRSRHTSYFFGLAKHMFSVERVSKMYEEIYWCAPKENIVPGIVFMVQKIAVGMPRSVRSLSKTIKARFKSAATAS